MTWWTEDQDAQLIALARDGQCGREIAEQMGRSRNSIVGRVHRLGIRLRGERDYGAGRQIPKDRKPPYKWNEFQDARLRSLAAKGLSLREIGREFGCDKTVVFRRAKKIGVQVRAVASVKPVDNRPVQPKPAPKLTVVTNASMLVQDFIAKNGVRRFAPGDRSDYGAIQYWLADRGYRMISQNSRFVISGHGEKSKSRDWPAVIEFVDQIRVREGLHPFVRGAA